MLLPFVFVTFLRPGLEDVVVVVVVSACEPLTEDERHRSVITGDFNVDLVLTVLNVSELLNASIYLFI